MSRNEKPQSIDNARFLEINGIKRNHKKCGVGVTVGVTIGVTIGVQKWSRPSMGGSVFYACFSFTWVMNCSIRLALSRFISAVVWLYTWSVNALVL